MTFQLLGISNSMTYQLLGIPNSMNFQLLDIPNHVIYQLLKMPVFHIKCCFVNLDDYLTPPNILVFTQKLTSFTPYTRRIMYYLFFF